MNQHSISFLLAGLALMSATGCGGGKNASAPAATAEATAVASPKTENAGKKVAGIHIAADATGRLGLQEVAERPMPRNLVVTGKVQFNEDQMARILAPIAGQVADLRIHVGDVVKTGDLLFSIRSREVAQLVTEYVENRRDVDLAEKTLAMTKDLFEHQAASRISLQQAESELAKANARIARAAASLRVYGLQPPGEGDPVLNTPIDVRSPIAGNVVERTVTAGQFVQPESGSLLTIADLSTVWVLAEVFERDIRFVRPGMRGDVTPTSYPDQKFTARVARIHDTVDPETRTVKVRFLVNNPQSKLKPEMSGSVSLFLTDSERTIAIPAAAVLTEGGVNFVYVQTAPDRLERRIVELSTEGGDNVRIKSGLTAGERVVTQGTLLIRKIEREEEAR